MRRRTLWIAWTSLSVVLAGILGAGLVLDADASHAARWALRKAFLPGATTHGHHQIELRCESCHGGEPFAGPDALQAACMRCHGAELKEARDSHPRSKFTDPRNAERAARLDAARCVTCHVEHRPAITQAVGVTLQGDFCVICHDDVGKDRPTHAGLAFSTCASSGCHNFHDNRALYEDFLVKHAQTPERSAKAVRPARDFASIVPDLASYPLDRFPLQTLARHDGGARATGTIGDDWLASAHARNGVNCTGCHQAKEGPWIDKPGRDACAACHADEAKGFVAGKHGMREAAGLGAMRPVLAKVAMRADAADRLLQCTSCHGAHRFDTRKAAAEACLSCHDDGHSRAWETSPHARLWRDELAGLLPAGSGVPCAACHMPRVEHRTDDVKRVLVQHNQSDNLRPSDKQLRTACMGCHGLGFSIDALADRALVQRNFSGRPAAHVRSIDMALEALRIADESRQRAKEPPR